MSLLSSFAESVVCDAFDVEAKSDQLEVRYGIDWLTLIVAVLEAVLQVLQDCDLNADDTIRAIRSPSMLQRAILRRTLRRATSENRSAGQYVVRLSSSVIAQAQKLGDAELRSHIEEARSPNNVVL
jgi:hypothetical protein